MKDRESITIDSDVNNEIKTQAKKETRSFSNMIEFMAKKYLMALKNLKKGENK